ncbi:hypothetical protein AVEN_165770-1 [Araneus ventricosus]|uniref:Uncharacterized protein n=1 Tax=Araneus ventricosus TaxID=182803 RepID=A0A4Y2N1J8_ARAVE|nr:hypothetical protein AVEN_165770-1 [Araneus ventricosus]
MHTLHTLYCYESLSVGVWCKQSNTQDIGELRFIHNYAGKHVAQRSAHHLSSSHCRRNSKVGPVDQHTATQNRSASNSLLASKADRTPKTFALQGDPSRSTFSSPSKSSPYIVYSGRPWRHMKSSSTFKRISFANRDKIPASLRSHISSPNLSPSRQDDLQVCRQGQGSRRGCCRSSHTYPCKTLFPNIRLTLLGSDFPCL